MGVIAIGRTNTTRAKIGYATARHISAIIEQEKASADKSDDQDRRKGATEQDQLHQNSDTSMNGYGGRGVEKR